MQRANERRNQLRRDALGWSFLLPSLLFLGCFTIYPIVKAIINSFQKVNLGKQTYQFIGLKNYTDVFNDKVFITVLGNTFKFALFVIPLSMVIGFFLAMLVKREARGVGFARALIYYPNIAPTIGFATVWTYLLTPTVGFISQVAKMMGVTAPDFLNDPQYAIYTIMVVYLWREAGFVMIFYTSGLQNISPEYYEAALIDGASPFTMLRKITLPLVRPTTVFVLMCTMANSFKMVDLIVTMTKALACAERVASVFDIGADAAYVGAQDQKLADKVDKSAPFLDFKHVSLTYQGAGAPTLQDMNFTVNRGDTVGIIGGTGSGKTSLVNLIPGFYPATEGEILLEGRDIRTMSDEELRGRIGVVPQKAVLFKGTIRSNLQWGKPDATEEEMWKALELAQASEVVDGKPGKLDATVAQNGKNFSGGQRQRLTIARALVRNPEILILDDSASALDYATDAKLRAAIRTLEDKTTTFIVSQRASTIRHADKIIVLDDGEIAGMGTHDELLKDCTVYQEIYYSQYPEQRGGVR